MQDLFIFGFGLAVSIVVGSGLVSLIVVKNRSQRDEGLVTATIPVAVEERR